MEFLKKIFPFIISVISALLLYLVCPPREMYWFQWIFLIPFFWAIELQSKKGLNSKKCFITGWFAGICIYLSFFYWIIPATLMFTGLPLIFSIFCALLFAFWGGIPFGLFGVTIPYIRKGAPVFWPLIVSTTMVSIEILFPVLFPWRLGFGQIPTLPILQLASLTGILGITFLVVLINSLLYQSIQIFYHKKMSGLIGPALSALLLITTYIWGNERIRNYDKLVTKAKKTKIAMIQSGLEIPERRKLGGIKILELYKNLTNRILFKKPELILWPENALRDLKGDYIRRKFLEFAQTINIPFLIGGYYSSKEGLFNSVYYINKKGKIIDRYDKRRLLAFGEYMPFSDIFPWLKGKVPGVGQFSAGKENKLWNFQGKKMSPIICYEAMHSGDALEMVKAGARILVNMANDSWFQRTDAAYQHLMFAAVQSTELGVPFLRSTNAGITTFVDPVGRKFARTKLLEPAIWYGEVPLTSIPTLFRKIGNLFAYICVMITLLFFGWPYLLKLKRKN